MADEPEVQTVTEAEPTPPEAVVEPEEELGDDINLNELMHLQDPLTGDEEPEEEADKPLTPAEKKKLRDLEAEDTDLAAELAERDNRIRVETAAQAAQAERFRGEQAAWTRQVQEFDTARTAQMQYRAWEDGQLELEGARDPVARQEKWETSVKPRREEEDNAWAAWIQHRDGRHQQEQAVTNIRVGEQKVFLEALSTVARAKVPKEVLNELYSRTYPQEMGLGFATWLADSYDAVLEYGKKLGRAETSTERERERRRTLSAVGLAQPAPDMGAQTRGNPPSSPTMAEVENWSWEKRREALEKDPHFYEKAEIAGRRAAARRR